MKGNEMSVMYESSSERELIKMWEDINGGNVSGVNRSLMKAIAKNEEEKRGDFFEIHQEEPLYKKRMWDSSTSTWIPFSIWDAYTIVKNRKENIIVQIWRPLDIQPEYDPILKNWQTIDVSYLNEYLYELVKKEEDNGLDTSKFSKIGAGIRTFKESLKEGEKEFREMIRQDNQELTYEGRYDELIENRGKNRA